MHTTPYIFLNVQLSSHSYLDMANQWVGSGQVVSIGLRVKMGHFKHIKNGSSQSDFRLGRIDLYFCMKLFLKENNIFLLFGKSHSKLLDIKCIILNLPLISRMNSAKQINTCLIILKLYNSSITNQNKIAQRISKTNTQVSFLHNINILKHKTKLQILYWITNLTKNKST